MKNLGVWIVIIACIVLGKNGYAQNYAISFDGSNNYVDFGTNSPPYSNTVTVEAWIKTASSSGQVNILSWGHTSYGDNVQFRVNAGKLEFGMHDVYNSGSWASVQSSLDINNDQWNHVAVVKNGTSITLYVNGVADGSTSMSKTMYTDRMVIGAFYQSGSKDYYFDGSIDEVRVWDDARSEAEIKANMYKELAGNESNLVAYYKMSDGTGTGLTDDHTSNSYDGTLTNGPSWLISSAFFGPKNCLDFDGSDDYVDVSLSSSGGNIITIEQWVYFNSLTNQQNMIHINQGSSSNTRIVPYKDASNQINLFMSDASNNAESLSSGYTVSAGTWYHMAFVYDNKSCYIYINGRLCNSGTFSYSYSLDGSDDMFIGNDYGYGFCSNVKMDEVRIWSTARTAAQIRENMCKTLEGDESGLIAYYNFDNTGGTTLQDFSGNGNDGTLTNMDESTDWVSSSAFVSWLNTNSSSWSTTSNWSTGALPGSTDNVGINYWAGTDPEVADNTTVNNLVIGASTSVDLGVGNSLTVSENLLAEGTFTVKSNALGASGTGSLITSGEVEGNITVERYVDGSIGGCYHLLSSPVGDATGSDLSSDYNYYEYQDSLDSWNRIYGGTSLVPGTGYLSAYDGTKTLSFTGSPNNGNVYVYVNSSSVNAAYDDYNLVGNPYPSRLDASAFITDSDNGEISGTVYFWTDDESYGSSYSTADYSTWNTVGSVGSGVNSAQTPTQYIEVGQGFVVDASSGGNVIFKNSHRVHDDPGQFYSVELEKQRLWLLLTNSDLGINNEILIGFLEEATVGYDRLFDGRKKRGNENIAFYTRIEGNEDEYVIQGLPSIEEEVEVELGYFSKESYSHEISMDAIENMEDYDIILLDKKLNKTTDLSKENYAFTSISGEEPDRFVLKISKKVSGMIENVLDKVNLFSVNGQIHINGLESQARVMIFDMLGNLVEENEFAGSYSSKSNLYSCGCYLVHLTSDSQVLVRKMIVE